jgi:tetratricopeptide (TPR) repeat protein
LRKLVFILSLLCSLNISAGKYEYFYIEAVRQQDMGNYIAAFELFRHCHELNPNAPEANYALGTFYMAMQKDSLGIAYLKRATELEPDNNEFGERLAQTYLYQNNIPAAAEVYE